MRVFIFMYFTSSFISCQGQRFYSPFVQTENQLIPGGVHQSVLGKPYLMKFNGIHYWVYPGFNHVQYSGRFYKLRSPISVNVQNPTKSREGECEVINFQCSVQYPPERTRIFECSNDFQCPVGYKCCPNKCFTHSVCQIATVRGKPQDSPRTTDSEVPAEYKEETKSYSSSTEISTKETTSTTETSTSTTEEDTTSTTTEETTSTTTEESTTPTTTTTEESTTPTTTTTTTEESTTPTTTTTEESTTPTTTTTTTEESSTPTTTTTTEEVSTSTTDEEYTSTTTEESTEEVDDVGGNAEEDEEEEDTDEEENNDEDYPEESRRRRNKFGFKALDVSDLKRFRISRRRLSDDEYNYNFIIPLRG